MSATVLYKNANLPKRAQLQLSTKVDRQPKLSVRLGSNTCNLRRSSEARSGRLSGPHPQLKNTSQGTNKKRENFMLHENKKHFKHKSAELEITVSSLGGHSKRQKDKKGKNKNAALN